MLMNDIMLSLSDGQTILGIALLLAALAQIRSLSLYHLHIVYDTACFTAYVMQFGLGLARKH
jgi:hypothetical protein